MPSLKSRAFESLVLMYTEEIQAISPSRKPSAGKPASPKPRTEEAVKD